MTTRKFKRVLLIGSILVIPMYSADFYAEEVVNKTAVDYSAQISHKTHIQFNDDCTGCHLWEQDDGLPELNKPYCDKCHDEQGTPKWEIPGQARELQKIAFKHNLHTRQAKCVECHKTTMTDRHRLNTPLVSPDKCISCHTKKKVLFPMRNCRRCHGVDRNRVSPKNHGETWSVRHGREERWSPARDHGKKCQLCHRNTACVACHRSKRPRSHTGLWRIRIHGTQAKWDRDRCKTCHETGACISCHRRTPPQNHRGAWGAIHGLSAKFKSNSRCLTCHNPAWCTNCHRGASR